MTNNLVKKYNRGGVAVVVAHVDSPSLTYEGVHIPDVVPLYANFDVSRHIGSARLIQGDGKVYALYEIASTAKLEFGLNPPVVLAVSGATKVEAGHTMYLRDGAVTAASVVKEEAWEALYGKVEKNDLATDIG